MTTYLNIPFYQTRYVQQRIRDLKAGDDTYSRALRLVNLYGWIDYRTRQGNRQISQGEVHRDTGLTPKVIRADLEAMQTLGWLTHTSTKGTNGGTLVKLHGIPFPALEETCEYIGESVPEGQFKQAPRDSSTVPQGQFNRPSGSDIKEGSKKQKQDKKDATPSKTPKKEQPIHRTLIETWNEHKPKTWVALSSLSPSRLQTIDALGGPTRFIALIPDVMAEAKRSDFWGTKQIDFENLLGTGKVPKAHFVKMAERSQAITCKGSNQNTANTLEHPDFYPPSPITGELRCKRYIADDDEMEALRREAIEFYATQPQQTQP